MTTYRPKPTPACSASAIPSSLGTLRTLWDAGVFGFKCFLSPSGVDEFPHLSPAQLAEAMREIAGFGGLLIVHAEDPSALLPHAGGTDYQEFLASRPDAAETSAIARVIAGVRETGCRAHILHLSSAAALPELRSAQAEGLPISAEWISEEELAAQPEMVKTMKVKPPVGQGRVRLVRIGEIDLQPCGGTHVRSTAEIGPIRIGKIEKKGRENRRVNLHFAE